MRRMVSTGVVPEGRHIREIVPSPIQVVQVLDLQQTPTAVAQQSLARGYKNRLINQSNIQAYSRK